MRSLFSLPRLLVMAVSIVSTVVIATPAQALVYLSLSASGFDPGRTVTNTQFFDTNPLTETEIQDFLDYKIDQNGGCDSTHDYCLNVLTVDTFDRPATSINGDGRNPLCGAYGGARNEPAARVIFKVQNACHISAKTLLVTLEKEQGLVTNTNPSSGKLKIAMGFGCPDTAPCDSQYFGFYNQVYKAASQLKRYTDPASSFYGSRPVGKTSCIALNPDSATVTARPTFPIVETARDGRDATVVTSAEHTASRCTEVKISGSNHPGFDGTYRVTSNPNVTSFTVKTSGTGTYAAVADPGTVKVYETQCGFKAVHIDNAATHALYLYTPYTPNRAALNNLGASGDSCSAYGNRNFWYFYNKWFNVKGNLESNVADKTANESLDLGAVVNDSDCTSISNACAIEYANGYAGWRLPRTFYTVTGELASAYRAAGGPAGSLGDIRSNARQLTGGSRQAFDKGFIYRTDAGTIAVVNNSIHAYFASTGGLSGPLGWPRENAQCNGSRCAQLFTGGLVMPDPNGNFLTVTGAIADRVYEGGGVANPWGLPRSNAVAQASPTFGNGRTQEFVNGTVWEGLDRAFLVPTRVLAAIDDLGGSDRVGWPRASAKVVGGAQSQSFTAGIVVSTSTQRGRLVPVELRTAYLDSGGLGGFLGEPRRSVRRVIMRDASIGKAQLFVGGSIMSGPTGTFAVPSPIREAYIAKGGTQSTLGWPIATAVESGDYLIQRFQGGRIKVLR